MIRSTIRPGRPEEAAALSDLAMRSKAHWGYDAQFLESCCAALVVSPDRCDGIHLFVATVDGVPAGFANLSGTPPTGELTDLWIDPPYMGQGLGRQLFEACCDQARTLGFTRLVFDADPNAEAFYAHMGAIRIGSIPSTIDPARSLPLMAIDVPLKSAT